MTLTIYRIDDTGINGSQGHLLYLEEPTDLGPECEVVAMEFDVPDGYEAWSHEDGAAYCSTGEPGVSGCQLIYEDGRIVLRDA